MKFKSILSLVSGLALAFILVQGEPDWSGAWLALACFGLVAALVFGLTLRPFFACSLALLVFATIWVSASFKFGIMAMNLHVYDAVLYLPSWPQAHFYMATFPDQAVLMAICAGVAVLVLALIFRFEKPYAILLRTRLGLVGAALLATSASSASFMGRNVDFFTQERSVFSAFFTSFGDLPQLIRFNGLLEVAAAPSPIAPLVSQIECRPDQAPPDIVLTLNESAMPPGVYPTLNYPEELNSFFASSDGVTRALRVETFGGGTWLTDFSVLTGLPTRSFGHMRNFVAQFMTGRIRHSLPQYLKACGYETIMVYPTNSDFAGVKRLYTAIGFDQIIDARIHKAPNGRQRDAFYLDRVAQILEAEPVLAARSAATPPLPAGARKPGCQDRLAGG